MSLGLSAVVGAAVREHEKKEAEQKEKKDTDNVSSMLVNSSLTPGEIAKEAGTSIEFVYQTNEKLKR